MNKTRKRKRAKKQISDNTKPLSPHNFQERLILRGGQPTILLTPNVYQDMCQLVKLVKNEIGWLGAVEKIDNNFLIKEIFLFDQTVDYVANVISADAMIAWADKLTDERPDGMEILNSVRFWGHSHVDMATSPSFRDDDQMKVFAKSCDDFFIRGIANRLGRLEFTLYLFPEKVEIHDCAWSIHIPEADPTRKTHWQKEIKEKVREKKLSVCRSRKLALYDLMDIYPELEEICQEIMNKKPVKKIQSKRRR
jgi:hypothetical protein